MHIGFNTFALSSKKTGAGIYISKLIEYLSYIDRDNIYSIFINKNNYEQFLKVKADNFKKIDAGSLTRIRPLRILWEQIALPSYIVSRDIDIFHSPVFVSPPRLKCKSIITVFDMTFFRFPDKHSKIKRHYFSKFIPLSVRRADKIITLSENSKRDIIDFFKVKPDKVKVIYLAADETFRPIEDPSFLDRVRIKHGIQGDFILFVGVLEPRKNLLGLIKAYYCLKKDKNINEKLVITGKRGWDYMPVLRLVRELRLEKDIIFTGYVPEEDLILLYNAAKIFIYPSLYEGFGLPVLEAMACGTPVITSQNSALQEIAKDAAILIDPLSEGDMARNCYELLSNPSLQERLRQAGLGRARQFSWKDTARQTLEVYKNL